MKTKSVSTNTILKKRQIPQMKDAEISFKLIVKQNFIFSSDIVRKLKKPEKIEINS